MHKPEGRRAVTRFLVDQPSISPIALKCVGISSGISL